MAKITIEDISRETGLSRGTVSRAINDRPDISTATKQLVLETCRRLNYVPSHAARSLATGRCYALAVVVTNLRDPFSIDYLRGVIRYARSAHYSVTITELSTDAEIAAERLLALSAERVDGVLICAHLAPNLSQPLQLATEDRVVVATSGSEKLAGDVLAPDWADAGRLMYEALARAGEDCLLIADDAHPATPEIVQGFSASAGIDARDTTRILHVPSARKAAEELQGSAVRLRSARGVGATSDLLAAAAHSTLLQLGRVPGRDVALVGCGNTALCSVLSPTISSIELGAEEIGSASAEILIQRLGQLRMDAPSAARHPPRLFERQSSFARG